eukprot:CAMPEP_0175195056 /NCGR_PEP_ID=MMETSP0093-20121207/6805_1 /TAXON_ID=311494 /ORGANISM="Alexandrium monilatum, Strain CCMP3105" /LENGTH=441 /DNA_ID=CAMNT_0016487987 /DNA_START=108 /DNA_END=1430 /DNA_ORIENTATION=-
MTREQWLKHQKGMDAMWPLPPHMEGEKGHVKYKDETYALVTRWTAGTKIAYRPHAKAPGSKSHLRYEKYSRATTVGEALKLGSYPADWCWDYERGFIKVVGGQIRDEPLDISKGDESQVTDVDRAINTWYVRELAKMLSMKPAELSKSLGWGESVHIRALRLLAQREASERLEAADREGRRITDAEVLLTLKRWPFFRNPWRKNVMQPGKTWVFSDTLGLLRDRQGDIHLTAPTRRYPQVAELFARWLTDRLPEEAKGFTFTSMNVNCNYAAAIHRDNGNFGPSFIRAFGDFSGGALNYWPEDTGSDISSLPKGKKVSFDLGKGLALFNGNCAHSVEAFEGSRYSIVYFTLSCHASVRPEDRAKMRQLGVPLPAADADPYQLLRPPAGYGAKATPTNGGKPAFRFFEAAALDRRRCGRKAKSAAEVKKIASARVAPENARS